MRFPDQAENRLRFSKKSAGVDIASQSARRNTAKIVNATGVRAVVETGRPSPTPEWKTAWRRRTITRGLILFDGRPDERAGRGTCGSADGCTADITCRCTANDRSGRSTYSGPLTNW